MRRSGNHIELSVIHLIVARILLYENLHRLQHALNSESSKEESQLAFMLSMKAGRGLYLTSGKFCKMKFCGTLKFSSRLLKVMHLRGIHICIRLGNKGPFEA